MLSALLIVLGLILAVMSFQFNSKDTIINADLGDLTEYVSKFRQFTFALILLGSLVAIITGVLGTMCTCGRCKKNRCYVIFWGISLSLVWVIFIVVGLLIIGNAKGAPEVIEGMCEGDLGADEEFKPVLDQVTTIDTMLAAQVNENMCSVMCPCNKEAAAPWIALGEEELNTYKRTATERPANAFATV